MFKYMETIAALNTCLLKQACDRFLGDDKDRNGQNGDDQYENQLELGEILCRLVFCRYDRDHLTDDKRKQTQYKSLKPTDSSCRCAWLVYVDDLLRLLVMFIQALSV